MADCYWHGYSGGPGSCSDCDRAARMGKHPSDVDSSAPPFTMEELNVRSMNEIDGKRRTLKDVYGK